MIVASELSLAPIAPTKSTNSEFKTLPFDELPKPIPAKIFLNLQLLTFPIELSKNY
jgi:hypothetical protein